MGSMSKSNGKTDQENDEFLKQQDHAKMGYGDQDMTSMHVGQGNEVTQSTGGMPDYYTTKDGTKAFSGGDGQIYYEGDNGRWTSHTNANDYYIFSEPQAPKQTDTDMGGGKKPDKDKGKPKVEKGKNPGEAGSSPGLGTSGIVDTTGQEWWTNNGPVTPDTEVNGLVDPRNWMHQVDPKHQEVRDMGKYLDPNLPGYLI